MTGKKPLQNFWVNDEDQKNAEQAADWLERNGLKIRNREGKVNHSRLYRLLVLFVTGQLKLEVTVRENQL